jgi:hypothetical protein
MESLPGYVILWILQRLRPADRRSAAITCRAWAAVADWPEVWDDLRSFARVRAFEAVLRSATGSVDRARAAVARLRITPGLLCGSAPQAVQLAINAGNIPVTFWFVATFGTIHCHGWRMDSEKLLPWACQAGHLDMAKALYERYPPDDETLANSVRAASTGGCHEVMRWLMAAPRNAKPDVCAVYAACVNGHLAFAREFFEPVDWGLTAYWDVGSEDLHGNTPPEDEISNLSLVRAPERTFIETCRRGHLEVAQWLAKDPLLNRCDAVYHAAVTAASGEGRLPVVIWLAETSRKVVNMWCDDAMEEAAAGGHTHVLQWMFDRLEKYVSRIHLLTTACSSGRLATAQWLVSGMYVPQYGDILYAHALQLVYIPLAGNHLELAQWTVSQFPGGVCHAIVRQALSHVRSLEAIRWLIGISDARGFEEPTPLTVRRLVRSACGRGDIEAVQWLAAEYEVDFAAEEGRGFEPLFQRACAGGHCELARWIAGRCAPAYIVANAQLIAGDLCYQGRDDVVKWLVAQRWLSRELAVGVGVTRSAEPPHEAAAGNSGMFQRACQGGELQLARWLRERYHVRWDDIRDFVSVSPDLQCHVREWLRATYPECRGMLATCPQNDLICHKVRSGMDDIED